MRCTYEQKMMILILLPGVIQLRAFSGRRGGVSVGDDISFEDCIKLPVYYRESVKTLSHKIT